MEQRLNPVLWIRRVFYYHGTIRVFFEWGVFLGIFFLGGIVIAGLIYSREKFKTILVLLLICLSGPMIFFNLFRHDYYQTSIQFFYAGIFTILLIKPLMYLRFSKCLIVFLFVLQAFAYSNSYYFYVQDKNIKDYIPLLKTMDQLAFTTKESDIILVSSKIPSPPIYSYYTERKINMYFDPRNLDSELFDKSMQNVRTSGLKVGAIVLRENPSSELLKRLNSKFKNAELVLVQSQKEIKPGDFVCEQREFFLKKRFCKWMNKLRAE